MTLSEHHGSPDGYLPSPLPMAAAVAARTERIQIQIAAMVAPFHDPLRLAEDAAVVDLLSRGRLELVIANGYVAEEFAMFGVPMAERVARTTEVVETLRRAWSGEPFEYRGRTVRVTPPPHRERGPKLALGRQQRCRGPARRPARGQLPCRRTTTCGTPTARSASRWAARTRATSTAATRRPRSSPRTSTRRGTAIGPYVLHEANAYGAWAAAAGADTGYTEAADVEALRATGQYKVVTPDELVAAAGGAGAVRLRAVPPAHGRHPPGARVGQPPPARARGDPEAARMTLMERWAAMSGTPR